MTVLPCDRPKGEFPLCQHHPFARLFAVSVAVLTLLLLGSSLSTGAGFGRLRVSFIDVGRGDAILIQSVDGFDTLIDGELCGVWVGALSVRGVGVRGGGAQL
jgi:beta-lactamase superfamily II metal-dependent hydrolase